MPYADGSLFSCCCTETGNLIDLSSDAASAVSASGVIVEHNYVNDTVIAASRDTRREQRDAFDMR